MEHSRNVCRLYKELLILIKRLPLAQIDSAWTQARTEIRKHKTEPDKQKSSDLLKQLVSKISYLKTITPRYPGDNKRLRLGSGHWVVREGKLVDGFGETKGQRAADGKISMDEAYRLNQKLLRRQFFGQDPPPNPAGVF